MRELQVFTYNEVPLRTVEISGEVWWVLKDVCRALAFADHKSILRRLDMDEADQIPLIDSMGREQLTYIINEPGLYNVILRSEKAEAKVFKRWVTHEVLPQIRAKGTYNRPMSSAQLIAAQAQLMVEHEKRMDELASKNKELEEKTATLETKVDKAVKVFSRPSEDHWREDIDGAIKELCKTQHLSIMATKGRMYDALEQKANCNISARLSRLKARRKKAGAKYAEVRGLSKLEAIAVDKQLRAIFESIVREWQAKAAV